MRDALRYRFLFEQMVRRELRRKYQGSALGVAWYLVNPLVLMGAYYLMFGVVFKVAEHRGLPAVPDGRAGRVDLLLAVAAERGAVAARPGRR